MFDYLDLDLEIHNWWTKCWSNFHRPPTRNSCTASGILLTQTVVGPVAAFFTFIGSMGNIPLAALLYGHGISFPG